MAHDLERVGVEMFLVEWSEGVDSQDRNNLILSDTSSQDCGPNDKHIIDRTTSLHAASTEAGLFKLLSYYSTIERMSTIGILLNGPH